MDKCVIDLLSAVTQIIPRYFNALGTRENGEQYGQVTENPFTAELYHRFKNIIETHINFQYYDNLILHFDITKLSVGMRPDLVLHEAQENRNVQKMFIEVKTDPAVNLTDDFNKLITATDTYLHFENAVLITVNRRFRDLLNLIRQHKAFFELEETRAKRIFFINVDSSNPQAEYDIYSLRYNRNNNRFIQ